MGLEHKTTQVNIYMQIGHNAKNGRPSSQELAHS